MAQPIIFPSSALTIKFHNGTRVIVTDVEIMEASGVQAPLPMGSGCRTKALWDTGATNSVIAVSTVKALNLKPIGKVLVEHGGGQEPKTSYVVNIGLPNGVLVQGVVVTETDSILKGICGAIIGMDIITKGDFTICNPGNETWMSYRYPSLAQTDYVEEIKLDRFPGTKPHAPCPCGKTYPNGKRIQYKNCCGKSKKF